MIDMGTSMFAGFSLIVTVFLVILAILWFMLPFAIFGTKDKLDELIAESKATNEHLAALRAEFLTRKGN
jgi:hypothetical protein